MGTVAAPAVLWVNPRQVCCNLSVFTAVVQFLCVPG